MRWRHDPPYSFQRTDGRITGLNVELTQAALARLACSANLVKMPWARALVERRDLSLSEAIVPTEVIVSYDPAHFALSRRSVAPAFVERFNQAVENLIQDGTYLAIAQRHLPCKVSVTNLGAGRAYIADWQAFPVSLPATFMVMAWPSIIIFIVP